MNIKYLTVGLICSLTAANAMDKLLKEGLAQQQRFMNHPTNFSRALEVMEFNTLEFKKACQNCLEKNQPEFNFNSCTYLAPKITHGTREAIIQTNPYLINLRNSSFNFIDGRNESTSFFNNQPPVTTSSTWSSSPPFVFQVQDPVKYTTIALFDIVKKN